MKPKHLPRLWCALQGVLPLEVRGTDHRQLPPMMTEQIRPAVLPSKLRRRSPRGRA